MYKLLITSIILYNSIAIGQDFNDFLNIGISAKSVAMGNAYTGGANSPFAIYYNPASLSYARHLEFETTISKLSFDRSLYGLGLVLPISPTVNFGFNWVNLRVSDIEARQNDTTLPDFLFNTYYNYLAAGLSVKLFNNFYIGNSLKFISLDISDNKINSFGYDTGLFYRYNKFTAGFMVRDLNTSYRLPDNITKKFSANYKLGFTYKYQNLLFAMDASKIDRKETSIKLNGGVEYKLKNISLRSGIYDKRLTVGAGINVPIKGNIAVAFNYAYKNEEFSSKPLHFFSLVFSGKTKAKKKQIKQPIKIEEIKPVKVTNFYKVTASALNVRVGPGINNQKIGKLLQESIVEVLETKYGWAKIKLNELEGWVSMDYLVRI